jgi:hypothetical protein
VLRRPVEPGQYACGNYIARLDAVGTLRAEGDRLSVSFDGKALIAQTDRTFTGLGKVALWTKADSVTHFDQIRITPLRVAAQSTAPK